jgi:hypothetical protein
LEEPQRRRSAESHISKIGENPFECSDLGLALNERALGEVLDHGDRQPSFAIREAGIDSICEVLENILATGGPDGVLARLEGDGSID